MQYFHSILGSRVSKWQIYGFAAAAAAFTLGFVVAAIIFPVQQVEAQQDPFLARRMDQIESRFYSIESRLNNLESVVRPTLSSPTISRTDDGETRFLRQEIDSLRTRIGELECGVLRLDERTLPASARSSRKPGTANSELCRRETGIPIALSARP